MNLAVTGVGMVSSLGLDVVTSCAASRAGLRRSTELQQPLLIDSEPGEATSIVAHEITSLTRGLFGLGRLLRLAQAAFNDLASRTDSLGAKPLGVILATRSDAHLRAWLDEAQRDPDAAGEVDWAAESEMIDAQAAVVEAQFLPRFLEQAKITPAAGASRLVRADQTGFQLALREASRWIEARVCVRCLIGGVDSYLDPRTLEALNRLAMLKTPDNPVGAMPGEAACFVVVEDAQIAKRVGSTILGRIDATAVINGASSRLRREHPGDGLSRAVSELVGSLPDGGRSTGLAVANQNGSSHRAHEMGQVVVRVFAPPGLAEIPIWSPLLSFGEIGAATGPVSVAMLVQAASRGYLASPNALVCLMSDDDTRGSFFFRSESGGTHDFAPR